LYFQDTAELLQAVEERKELYCLSNAELCKILHLSESTYYRWKRGIPPTQIDSALAMINFLEGDVPSDTEE
jgi:hypothetical protein